MRIPFTVLFLTSTLQADITWERRQLHGDFYSEGAAIGDINGDGKPDIVAGPFWWEGPAFEKKHAYYEPKIFNINGYSDNFFDYVRDFNADQKNDILILGFPGKEARLYLNPGTHDDKPWPMHIVADVVDNESPVFTDITGDGKPEIVCSTGGKFGWFAPNWEKPTEKWPFIAVTEDMKVVKFTHGLGVGDVNGDGHMDLLEARRWWECPTENGKRKTDTPFLQHNFAAGVGGGAQMFAYDFDGNGTNDVFTSLQAHRYGVAVYLQNKTENGKPNTDQPHWQRIMLASEQPQDNDYGIVFSQPHAAALADINGDGIKDIVTGKRYWAHNGHDPDERGHRVVYWYETKRDGKGGLDFIPHLVDAASGVGVDVTVGDITGDSLPDIVTANKGGVFILTQQRSDAAAAAPVKLYGPGLKPQADYAKGQWAADALKNIQLPTGFKAELIAAEPDVVQPIAFTFDERGRIWVVEGNSYPQPREVGKGQDRIKILEDQDGDGTYETKKIFCEGLNLVSGIELGFGGVWVGAAPYLMFIPREGDSTVPSNRTNRSYESYKTYSKVPGLNFTAYALLDGWGTQDTHETLNSFIWGPDGWLYGCHGVFTHSRVGKPGTPDDQREPINAGVWRYHPVRHEFEVFAHGTSNPWGLDYDQNGEWFVTACVIPHLYHIVPGGRYHRQAGQHFNAHTYEDIKTIADHAHYAGNPRPDVTFDKTTGAGVMNNDTNALGGGHAHCGLAIYQSSLFPPTYRNQMIFGNLHGHRLVANYTDPNGSSYTGKHAADFMRANDMHFIPVTQKVGPDGALYVSDWSDQQICHRGSGAVEHWDRSNGRIYRVTYDGWKPWKGDLANESDEALAKLAVQTKNEWESRMARRVLAQGTSSLTAEQEIQRTNGITSVLSKHASATSLGKIRRAWLAIAIGGLAENATQLIQDDEHESVAIIRSLDGKHFQFGAAEKLVKDLSSSASPIIRREAASLLQRMPDEINDEKGELFKAKTMLATALLKHGEDKDDPMIPLLIWYGIEPVVAADPAVGMQLAKVSKMPKVTGFIYRRLSSDDAGRTSLLKLAAETPDAGLKLDLLNAVVQAARGGNKITKPDGWEKVASTLVESGNATKVAATLLELEAHMGIETALATYRDRLGSASTPPPQRETALDVLLQSKDSATSSVLLKLIQGDTPALLRRKSIQALASLNDSNTPALLSSLLPKLPATDLPDAINTLASTKEGAKALLKAVESKTVPATALSPFLVRQLTAFGDSEIDALIKSAWGDVNAPKADMAERVKKYRDLLTPTALAKGNLANGKLLFHGVCGACHKLFGQGQNVGPDITGSNRADLGYLLENVLDPNAVIGKAYQLNLFTMKDGRLMSGVIKEETAAAVRIAMMGGVEFTLPVADIAKREVSKLSTMPEGLFDALQPKMVIDLVKYLQSGASTAAATQVAGALEGESLKVLTITGGQAKKQGMGGFGADWSGAAQLWWTGGKPDQKLTLALPVKEAGKYALKGALTMARDYGVVSILLNGKPITSSFDGYNGPKVIHTGELDWGSHDLPAGEHQLTFTLAPPNPAAVPRNMVGLDYVRLEKR
jgi:putative membrane-bound dehydrogenase-like protein